VLELLDPGLFESEARNTEKATYGGGEFLCNILVLDVAETQARFDGLSQHTVAGSCERDDEGGR
jgi:hypothetical protein